MSKPNFELLKDAYQIIDGIPKSAIDLTWVVAEHDEDDMECGTIACAAGWLAMHPKFKALGLGVQRADSGLYSLSINGEVFDDTYAIAMSKIFNMSIDDAEWLFNSRNGNRTALSERTTLSDKEVWKARVVAYLKENNALSDAHA